MSVLNQPVYRFREFKVDTDQKVLFRGDTPMALTPKLFDTLLILVENGGRIVMKEELMDRLWPETFVEEANLTSNIQQLRKVLGDNARNPEFIETVPKRGYRFISSVSTTDPILSAESIATANESSLIVEQSRRSHLNLRTLWLAALAIVIGITALSVVLFSRTRNRFQASNPKTMVAVLPFRNMTGDPGQDYFEDGLTEEMISQLGNLDSQRLGVIARTSIMHYKESEEPLDRIGKELGVQYVLEGSVRRDSDNVRITVELTRVVDQTRMWARQYDRELRNLLVLQGEIAQEVADEIQLTLADKRLTESTVRPATSPSYEVYDLYLKGQYYWNKRTTEGFRQAIDYFEQATTKDPTYARAYAGIANSYALMGGYSGQPQTEFMARARSAALRALALDEKLPEAHTALALIVQNYDWDWETSEKEFRRAIELNPNYATAHQWYAEHLAFLGRFDEALRESEIARQIDPFSLIIATDNGSILYYARQYDRAIEKLRAVLELDPNFLRAHFLDSVYVERGMYAEAEKDLEKWHDEKMPWSLGESVYVYGRSGQLQKAQKPLDKLEQLNRQGSLDPELLFWASLGMGKKDDALGFLEKAYKQHSNMLTRLKVDPAFDPLREDPRFKDLLHRVHLS